MSRLRNSVTLPLVLVSCNLPGLVSLSPAVGGGTRRAAAPAALNHWRLAAAAEKINKAVFTRVSSRACRLYPCPQPGHGGEGSGAVSIASASAAVCAAANTFCATSSPFSARTNDTLFGAANVKSKPCRAVSRHNGPALGAEHHRLPADPQRPKIPGGVTARTVVSMLVVLSAALDDAMRQGFVTRNVARMVKRPAIKHHEVATWTPQQATKFRDHIRDDRLAACWLLTLAGLRRSEILGLRWSDVDFDAGTVTVAQGRRGPRCWHRDR